jgi:3'-phosphoadenosine 5'-phosphosulfate (PAPS) 3'-phosphatase
MSLNLAAEQQVAVAAVQRACALTSSVFNTLVKGETLVKGDKSPVTGALRALTSTLTSALTAIHIHSRRLFCASRSEHHPWKSLPT